MQDRSIRCCLTAGLWAGRLFGTARAQDAPARPRPSRPPARLSQPAPPAQQPPPRAPAEPRRHRPAAPGHGRRPGGAEAAAGRVAAARPVHPAVVPDAGRRLGHRAADLSLLHPGAGEPAVRRRLGAVRREDREDPARGLPAAVGDQLPRGPVDRGRRRSLSQRRDGQAHHLQDGGAPARQDRRLRGQQEGRAVEDRRQAEGREHPDPPRHVHRSRADPARRRRRPRP